MAWEPPKTDWSPTNQQGVTGDDFNRIEGNILDINDRVNYHGDTSMSVSLYGFASAHNLVLWARSTSTGQPNMPRIVTLALPDTYFTDGNTDTLSLGDLPAHLRPNASGAKAPCMVYEGGTIPVAGSVTISTTGLITFHTLGVAPIWGEVNTYTYIINNTGETAGSPPQVSSGYSTERNFAEVARVLNVEKYLGLNDFKNGTIKGFPAQVITYPVWP